MNAVRLLGKDLRLLGRTPALLAILIGYPILVALLVALALGGEDRKPEVAFVNLDRPGATIQVGGETTTIDDYVEKLSDEIDLRHTTAEVARRALHDGRIAAILTVPEGFVESLTFGESPPTVELVTSRRSAVQSDAITRRLESAIFRINESLASDYIGQLVKLADVVIGGEPSRSSGSRAKCSAYGAARSCSTT